MGTWLNRTTGEIVRAVEKLPDHLVPVTGSGTLVRTRLLDGTWTAERCSPRRLQEALDEGWELVKRERVPVPETFTVGRSSGIRFGFAALSRRERINMESMPATAVVLPDEPGLWSAENCAGSRYMFQLGMLVGGAPADYLLSKVLTYRVRRAGIQPDRIGWAFDGAAAGVVSARGRTTVETLLVLATQLSDDLQSAARTWYGTEHPSSAWSREKQWQMAKDKRGVGSSG